MANNDFLNVAGDLDGVGLIWQPEIGDEVILRKDQVTVSILVDNKGMPIRELRQTYLWLPTIEQLVHQIEVRQAIIFHAGMELSEKALFYKTILQAKVGNVESVGGSFRTSFGLALRDLIHRIQSGGLH